MLLADLEPFQTESEGLLEAVQEEALVVVQESVTLSPLAIFTALSDPLALRSTPTGIGL